MQTIVLEWNSQRREKRAHVDMVLKGFHIRGWNADTNALDPTFALKVNHEDRLVDLPTAPFIRPFFLDLPMAIAKGSILEFEVTDQVPLMGTTNPILVLEYEPMFVKSKGKVVRQKCGNTMMRRFRALHNITTISFGLSPKHYCRVLNSFLFEDDEAAPATNTIAYPNHTSTNVWTLKYQVDDQRTFRFIEEGMIEWWKWGFYRRSAAAIGGGPVNLLQEVQRRRYYPGIMVRPMYDFFADRVIPAGGLTTATNFVFEYEYLSETDYSRMIKGA